MVITMRFIGIKKSVSFFLALTVFLTAGVLAGCGKRANEDEKLSVVVTIFPEYDWVRQILGDRAGDAEVTMLLDNGVDLHSYQPTADDIVKISTCDLFIYVGGESDKWVEDVLKTASNDKMLTVNLLDALGDAAKEEELVSGMEPEDHEHEDEGEDEETEYDEHVWLSLKNASALCGVIAEKLSALDPDGKTVYESNLASYKAKLEELDARYADAVKNASCKTVLFGDRFPFRYLTDDYGLRYFAAFSGCSAESEASFETIAFLAGKLDELSLPAVLVLEGSDRRIAQTIVATSESKSARIVSVNSMQSVTAEDVRNGANYLSVMESNLDSLKQALQ